MFLVLASVVNGGLTTVLPLGASIYPHVARQRLKLPLQFSLALSSFSPPQSIRFASHRLSVSDNQLSIMTQSKFLNSCVECKIILAWKLSIFKLFIDSFHLYCLWISSFTWSNILFVLSRCSFLQPLGPQVVKCWKELNQGMYEYTSTTNYALSYSFSTQ